MRHEDPPRSPRSKQRIANRVCRRAGGNELRIEEDQTHARLELVKPSDCSRHLPVRDEATHLVALQGGALFCVVVVITEHGEKWHGIAIVRFERAARRDLAKALTGRNDEATEGLDDVRSDASHEVVRNEAVRIEVVAEQQHGIGRLRAIVVRHRTRDCQHARMVGRVARRGAGITNGEQRKAGGNRGRLAAAGHHPGCENGNRDEEEPTAPTADHGPATIDDRRVRARWP